MRTPPSRDPGLVPEVTTLTPAPHLYRYCFLTPVFGGGVAIDGARKPYDPITPVRVASIRGQLRFWWRACNPRCCRDVAELRANEELVFGSVTTPSPLVVTVVRQPARPASLPVLEGKFGAVKGCEALAYGAFPLRGQDENLHGVLHTYDGEWEISLRYPEALANDVNAAVWAWTHFGGLGGRTRRGFGAIQQKGAPAVATIDEGWRDFVRDAGDVPWPHLPARREDGAVWGTKNWVDGRKALDFLLGKLRELRQGAMGRKPGPESGAGNHPGRSYWPEADAIRKLTGQSCRAHGQPVTIVDAFPRAAFGMPIIFHFKDLKAGDPKDSTLLPQDHGRLASRLILRPHAGDGAVRAMAVVLVHPAPAAVVLGDDEVKTRVKTRLTDAEARGLGANGRPSPLVKGDKVFTDPIQRFLEEIQ
ncbi:MAG: type III-B CRISPR module RAMP protein Cmr1 [Candidatus Schekmanbacteria bacterium]|nr:type III-B CRISPR module RAMP protein Cmr1 [Candidatus Schekmanbacteria bacterium]